MRKGAHWRPSACPALLPCSLEPIILPLQGGRQAHSGLQRRPKDPAGSPGPQRSAVRVQTAPPVEGVQLATRQAPARCAAAARPRLGSRLCFTSKGLWDQVLGHGHLAQGGPSTQAKLSTTLGPLTHSGHCQACEHRSQVPSAPLQLCGRPGAHQVLALNKASRYQNTAPSGLATTHVHPPGHTPCPRLPPIHHTALMALADIITSEQRASPSGRGHGALD